MANQRKRNGILDRIVNPVIEAVDPEALLTRVDLDQMLERVDLDELLARIDVDAIVQRVDVDAIVQRVDVDAIVQRVDVNAIVSEVRIAGLVGGGATQIATGALDVVRRQIARADRALTTASGRVVTREPSASGAPLAGPLSRLLAYAFDSVVVTALFGLFAAVSASLLDLVFGADVRDGGGSPWWGLAGIAWWYLYFAGSWTLARRTIGMGVVGIRVENADTSDLRVGSAVVRALVLPFSFVLGLGLVGIVIGRRRRALHDVAAGTLVVSDAMAQLVAVPGGEPPG